MKYKTLIWAAVLIIILGSWYYWQVSKNESVVFEKEAEPATLGSQVYDKAANPLEEKLPDTNPLENIYKNPFE